eukprot:354704-Chlamydomonas_euryale.AAC.4
MCRDESVLVVCAGVEACWQCPGRNGSLCIQHGAHAVMQLLGAALSSGHAKFVVRTLQSHCQSYRVRIRVRGSVSVQRHRHRHRQSYRQSYRAVVTVRVSVSVPRSASESQSELRARNT